MSNTTEMRLHPAANERTYLSWLHMAVTVGSIGAALLGFSGSAARDPHASTAVRVGGTVGGLTRSFPTVELRCFAVVPTPKATHGSTVGNVAAFCS